MSRILPIVLILFSLFGDAALAEKAAVQASATATAVEEQQFRVELGDRRIGTLLTQRVVGENKVMSRERFRLELGRSGTRVVITSDQRSEETLDGRPLAFSTRSSAAGTDSQLEGRIDEQGQLLIDVFQGNLPRHQEQSWPENALLTEGLRLAERKHGFKPGTRYRLHAFDMDGLQAFDIDVVVGEALEQSINGKIEQLIPVRQTLHFKRGDTESTAWVRADGSLRRTQVSIMGLDLTMTACDRDCDGEAVEDTDVLGATLAQAPGPLTLPQRHQPLRLTVQAETPQAREALLALGEVPGQAVLSQDAESDRTTLRIALDGDARQAPDADDLRPTQWLQSDDPAILRFAQHAATDKKGADQVMQALEAAVRLHIRDKSLRVGYASASETLHRREGDCTEHAVLLAAAARASGIPARVATGLVYTDSYAGQRDVFVPHAWVQAWVDGRWRGYDAALAGFDSSHLAFAVGDGNPYRYYQGMALLGNLQILDMDGASRADTP